MCVFSRNCEDRSQAFPDVATAIRTAAEGTPLPSYPSDCFPRISEGLFLLHVSEETSLCCILEQKTPCGVQILSWVFRLRMCPGLLSIATCVQEAVARWCWMLSWWP